MHKLVLTAIIHNADYKKILLVKRAREPFIEKWSLPGGVGAFEKEKDPEKAIGIEVFDDLGVKFNNKFYTLSYEKQPEPTIKLFFTGTLEGEPFNNSKETTSEIKWFGLDEILKIDLAFNDKDVLKKFITESKLK